jgi:SAM-dependent methyltransferase
VSARDARFHLRVQRYGWDLATDTYASGWVPLLARLAAACVDKAALAPGERVVDVATGPGTAAFLAADRVGLEGAVVATDISEKMVRLEDMVPGGEEVGDRPQGIDVARRANALGRRERLRGHEQRRADERFRVRQRRVVRSELLHQPE